MRFVALSLCLFLLSLYAHTQSLTIYKSDASVEQTTDILEKTIKDMNLVFFETVAHDKLAATRGVNLDPMREILFEDSQLSTGLIECQPTSALDLPFKILVWEENEDVYIAYFDPKLMQRRFMLTGCEDIINDMGRLMSKIVVDTLRTIQSKD